MYVEEIAEYFRYLADEPDKSFLSDARVAASLRIAYNQFREMVVKQTQEVYEKTYTFTPNGFFTDLNGILFGATPSEGAVAERMCRISFTNTNQGFAAFLSPAGSMEQLMTISDYKTKWFLQGTVLRYNYSLNNQLQLTYIPESTVNWAAGMVPSSHVFLDNLGQWHDIIALLAYKQYAIADYVDNPVLQQQLAQRIHDFDAFLSRGRSGDASKYVRDEDAFIV